MAGASPADRLQHFAKTALAFEPSSLVDRDAAVGVPDSVRSEPVPNRHVPGQTDSLITQFRPGLEVELYRTAPGAQFVQRIDVRSNRWLTVGPGISSSITDVTDSFGAPAESTDSSLAYTCHACGPVEEPITFYVRDLRVHRVRFAYYVD